MSSYFFFPNRSCSAGSTIPERKKIILTKTWKYKLVHVAENTFSQRRCTFGAYFSPLLAAPTSLHANHNTILGKAVQMCSTVQYRTCTCTCTVQMYSKELGQLPYVINQKNKRCLPARVYFGQNEKN